MTKSKENYSAKPLAIPKWLVALVDLSLANLGLYFSFLLVSGELQGYQIGPLFLLLPSVSLVTLFLFNNLGLYTRHQRDFMFIVRNLVTGVIGLTLFSILFAFMTRAFIFQRTVFLLAPLIQLLLLLGWRILYWKLELWIVGQKKLLVIGNHDDLEQTLEKLLTIPSSQFEVTRVIEPGQLSELPGLLDDADAVMLTGSIDIEQKNRIIRESFDRNREVFVIPELYEIILTRASMTQMQDTPVIECQDMQLGFLQVFVKRFTDLLITATLALPALAVTALIALTIRVTSEGPVLYAQERVGLHGRVFTLYKLRTMIVEAELESGPVFATEEDDRVTKVGRFLRLSRLDEIPQLFNVLRGDLSIVGPRPERPYFVKQFEQEMPEYKLRHLVKPGITGLAQVAGYYATNTHDKLRYDLYYIADYSLLMDFKVLLLTVPTLFNRDAARGLNSELTGRFQQNG
jgi:exopolysaccharide biosynthesis polyprenyl glycosylphosphotransferase